MSDVGNRDVGDRARLCATIGFFYDIQESRSSAYAKSILDCIYIARRELLLRTRLPLMSIVLCWSMIPASIKSANVEFQRRKSVRARDVAAAATFSRCCFNVKTKSRNRRNDDNDDGDEDDEFATSRCLSLPFETRYKTRARSLPVLFL